VLACTHFPLLKTEIGRQLEKAACDIQLVDSGKAIANRLVSLCQTLKLEQKKSPTRVVLMTELSTEPEFVSQLEEMGFTELQHLMI
jgi:glutamate racemase